MKAFFGAGFASPEHKARRFGPNGLVRLDDQGDVKFGFNETARDRYISDIYALTIDDEDRIWLCPYHEFFVASIDAQTIKFQLDNAPVAGASALSVGPDHFVFFGGYDRDCMIAVVERETLRLRLIQLIDQDGDPLTPRLIAPRVATSRGIKGPPFWSSNWISRKRWVARSTTVIMHSRW